MAGLKNLAQKLLSGGGPSAAREPNPEEDSTTRTELRVAGMTCAHCKAAVEGELARLSGVSAEADVETGVVTASYDASRVGPEQLEAAVQEAGYQVRH